MRTVAIIAALAFLTFTSVFSAAKDKDVDELKAQLETAHPEDRPELCIQIARRELKIADDFYIDGKIDQAGTAVSELVSYAEKARDSATETKKHLKNVEIDVRKMAEKLRDIKRTLAFDDQAPLDQAIHRLEDIRTALLKDMFAKKEKK